MKTYVINFTNGSRIRITGDPVEPTQDDSMVAIHNGTDVYNIQRENVLYWSGASPTKTARPRLLMMSGTLATV